MATFLMILLTLFILIYSVFNNIYLGYGLTLFLVFLTFMAIKRGFSIKKILNLYWVETKKSLNIVLILILIGMLISSWLDSGTIPSIVYYCIKYINPKFFILSTFLITGLISMLIGTSFGTISTIGLPLIIIGKAAGIDLSILAGAIFSGAYLGDRTSPLSSSLLLLCNLTDIKLFDYLKKLILNNLLPIALSIVFYLLLSFKFPLSAINTNLEIQLYNYFNISIILLLPALILFTLSIFKIKITYSIPISILCSVILSIFIQNREISTIFYHLFFGYSNNNKILMDIMHGGGIISMLKTIYIIIISCSISGFFSGLHIFDNLKSKLKEKNLDSSSLFLMTTLLGILIASIGCSQTIAIILTIDIVKDVYNTDKAAFDKFDFALDISNSAILTPALIPWCIASLVPCTILGINNYEYIIYSFYIYIVPITHFSLKKYQNIKNR